MITTVRIVGPYVHIDRGPGDRSILTFAEVKVAANVLRAHLLAAMPPEVPDLDSDPPPLRGALCRRCGGLGFESET